MAVTTLDAFSPATEMLAALQQRHVSAVELLELHLRRIERYNPALNALVGVNPEAARRAAAEADDRRSRGEDAPLLGLPVTLKESMNVRGWRTTAGIDAARDYVSVADGAVAGRVLGAGGVLVAKTNVPPALSDWQSNNRIYGRTNNPWDLGRTPGGSTGGGAAALAAGLTPLEMGSDIGGSIRVPAAFCGVYGHKPSETAVPRSGQFAVLPTPNPAQMLGVQGPLARTAADLELGFDVVAGPEAGEDVAWRLAIPPARHERLADFRVAVLPALSWLPVDSEVAAAQATLADGLRRLGARVEEAVPAGFGDLLAHQKLYLRILRAMTTARMSSEERRATAAELRATGDELDAAGADGVEATFGDVVGWCAERERVREAYRAFFRDWDVLLSPITPYPPYPHIGLDVPMIEHKVNVGDVGIGRSRRIGFAGLATLAGQPATAFPAGLTAGGLPIGLQAVGPYLEDRTPIRFAAFVAREFGGYHRPPGYED